ncbi:hypothetical protein D3C78_1334970 [compost metagenome]
MTLHRKGPGKGEKVLFWKLDDGVIAPEAFSALHNLGLRAIKPYSALSSVYNRAVGRCAAVSDKAGFNAPAATCIICPRCLPVVPSRVYYVTVPQLELQ